MGSFKLFSIASTLIKKISRLQRNMGVLSFFTQILAYWQKFWIVSAGSKEMAGEERSIRGPRKACQQS